MYFKLSINIQIQIHYKIITKELKYMQSNNDQILKQSLMNSISHHEGFGNYQVGAIISRGAYGHIFQLRNRIDNKIYVLKVLQAKNKNHLNRIKSQIKIQRNLKNRYIVNLIKDFKDQGTDKFSATNYYMILDYCEKGDLHKYLISKHPKGLPFNQLHSFCEQIARGVSYLHKNKIVHGDIKSSNILLNQKKQIKICDFGFAQILQQNQKLKQNRGTLTHMAPQTIHQYDTKADIWAFGVLMFELATGNLPFSIKSIKDLPQVLQPKNVHNYKYPKNLSNQMVDLFKHIFVCDSNKRYSINQVMNHPFFTGQKLTNNQFKSKQLTSRIFKSYTSAILINRQEKQQSIKRQSKQINNKQVKIEEKINYHNQLTQFTTGRPKIRHNQNKQNNKNIENISQKKDEKQFTKLKRNVESVDFKAKKVISPLKTQYMIIKPIQKDKSIIRINSNGITKITQEISKDNKKIVKVVNIDCEGQYMSIKLNDVQKKYEFEKIPQKYHKQYENCKTIVNMAKDYTPKIVYSKNQDPQNNIQIQIMHSGKIKAKINSVSIITSQKKINREEMLNRNESILKQYYIKLMKI